MGGDEWKSKKIVIKLRRKGQNAILLNTVAGIKDTCKICL